MWSCLGIAVFAVAVGVGMFLWWLLDPNEQRGRAFEAEMVARSPLTDAELVSRYFAGGELATQVPIAVRRIFAEHTTYPAEKLLPDDDLTFFWAELDAAEMIGELESAFGVTFSAAEVERTPCTIRAVSRLVASKQAEHSAAPLPATE